MADNSIETGSADGSKINLNEEYDIDFWTHALEITEAELRQAVKEVGVSADDVRDYFTR
ncbi:DUF3606 domain-containing protein [Dyadobacter bucti]|jgi:hypothetical protein|uniref:DUF3606 domain-containing protein n=1 Tax=Dyadobacter bucti TaxID=2572203 RepID=UPI0011084897|nr:DUF3606 domain-containing protein [Dyadobacter bucti]